MKIKSVAFKEAVKIDGKTTTYISDINIEHTDSFIKIGNIVVPIENIKWMELKNDKETKQSRSKASSGRSGKKKKQSD